MATFTTSTYRFIAATFRKEPRLGTTLYTENVFHDPVIIIIISELLLFHQMSEIAVLGTVPATKLHSCECLRPIPDWTTVKSYAAPFTHTFLGSFLQDFGTCWLQGFTFILQTSALARSVTDAEAWLTFTVAVNPQSAGQLSVGQHILSMLETFFVFIVFLFVCCFFSERSFVLTLKDKLLPQSWE